jgi:hypothetical protein
MTLNPYQGRSFELEVRNSSRILVLSFLLSVKESHEPVQRHIEFAPNGFSNEGEFA